MIEDWVPNVSSDVGSHILIQSLSGAAAVMANFKGFADLDVVCEASFLLSLHFGDNVEVFFVKLVDAVLVVLCNA